MVTEAHPLTVRCAFCASELAGGKTATFAARQPSFEHDVDAVIRALGRVTV